MGAHIRAEGWNNWGNAENEKTAYFAEYNSKGAGAKMSERVKWIHQLTKEEAEKFQNGKFPQRERQLESENGNRRISGKNSARMETRFVEDTIFDQTPLWYQTDEAARIADQIVLYQKGKRRLGKKSRYGGRC